MFDTWLYPEDLENENLVINLYFDEGDYKYRCVFYPLPENWKYLVTKDRGKDGKPSIHDIINV